ncbi:MAG: hypothetical protein Q9162_002642 [Coniocarpon cinnabarinum]
MSPGLAAYRLDGDNVRFGLNKDLGFSERDRNENIRRIGEVAKLFADSSTIAITSFISPYKADRDAARKMHEEVEKGGSEGLPFVEVFVNLSVEECEKRDPKGLYKKARAGEIKEFTGISAPYERPVNAEVVIDSKSTSVEDAVAQIVRLLKYFKPIFRTLTALLLAIDRYFEHTRFDTTIAASWLFEILSADMDSTGSHCDEARHHKSKSVAAPKTQTGPGIPDAVVPLTTSKRANVGLPLTFSRLPHQQVADNAYDTKRRHSNIAEHLVHGHAAKRRRTPRYERANTATVPRAADKRGARGTEQQNPLAEMSRTGPTEELRVSLGSLSIEQRSTSNPPPGTLRDCDSGSSGPASNSHQGACPIPWGKATTQPIPIPSIGHDETEINDTSQGTSAKRVYGKAKLLTSDCPGGSATALMGQIVPQTDCVSRGHLGEPGATRDAVLERQESSGSVYSSGECLPRYRPCQEDCDCCSVVCDPEPEEDLLAVASPGFLPVLLKDLGKSLIREMGKLTRRLRRAQAGPQTSTAGEQKGWIKKKRALVKRNLEQTEQNYDLAVNRAEGLSRWGWMYDKMWSGTEMLRMMGSGKSQNKPHETD